MPRARGCESTFHENCHFSGNSEIETELWTCLNCGKSYCHQENCSPFDHDWCEDCGIAYCESLTMGET